MFGIGAAGTLFLFAIKALSTDAEGRSQLVRADLPSFINNNATDTLNVFNDKGLLLVSRLYNIQL